MQKNLLSSLLALLIVLGCSIKKLPVLGPPNHKIPDFSFVNQNGETLNQDFVKGKVYVADFFFTTCPTICPIMKTQMERVYQKFKNRTDFALLSHSIDPRHDSVAVLKQYEQKLGVTSATWQFLTGDRQKIFDIGQKFYMVTAMEDKSDPSGLLHSGSFVLVDKKGQIRGLYDGTKKDDVDQLITDMDILFNEKP